jgi:hypothetical protein
VSGIPGVRYCLDASAGKWVAPGRSPLAALVAPPPPPPKPNRDGLPALYGTYIPGVAPNTVGLVDDEMVKTRVGDGVAVISIPSTTLLIENTDLRSQVNISGRATDPPLVIRNCRLWGQNPQRVQESRASASIPDLLGKALQNYSGRHVVLIDCLIDNGLWYDAGESDRISTQWSPALHGGNFTVERCLIRRFTDAINFAGRPNGVGSFVKVLASRICDNWYGASGQDGGYSHSDGFQFNTGANVEIAYSYIGGPFERITTATVLGMTTPGPYNAGLMIQQEQDGNNHHTANWLVDNFNIHHNWLEGSVATVNLNVSTKAEKFNPMTGTATSGCRIWANRIAVRPANSGFYIYRTTSTETYLGGNVFWIPGQSIYGNGVELTASNGGIVTHPDETT